MNQSAQQFWNVIGFIVLGQILCLLQTTLWFQIWGPSAPPWLWLILVTYIGLFRTLQEGVIITVLLALVESGSTVTPIALLLWINVLWLLGVRFIRTRIHWLGPVYFMLLSGAGVVGVSLLHILLSWLVENRTALSLSLADLLMSTLWTGLASAIVFPIARWLDWLTERSKYAELSEETL